MLYSRPDVLPKDMPSLPSNRAGQLQKQHKNEVNDLLASLKQDNELDQKIVNIMQQSSQFQIKEEHPPQRSRPSFNH